MNKHTPGPWKALDMRPMTQVIYIEKDDYSICEVQTTGYEDNTANAHLIAAAPEMLEAMQLFVYRVEKGDIKSQKTYELFKEIIAKATNQTQPA